MFQTDVSQPTPLLPATEFGAPFGGPPPFPSSSSSRLNVTTKSTATANIAGRHVSAKPSQQSASLDNVSDQVRWDRAWHEVTSRIQLPSSVAVEDSFGTLAPESQELDATFDHSLSLILDPSSTVPHATHTDDILHWHAQQVRHHFINHVLPLLSACADQGDDSQVLLSSIQTLEAAHRQYLYGLSLVVRGIVSEAGAATATSKFQRDLHAIIGSSWAQGLAKALHGVLRHLLRAILVSTRREVGIKSHLGDDNRVSKARNELLGLLDTLQKVGLAGERFEVLFAEAMDTCMQDFIRGTYAGVWRTPTSHDSSHSPTGPLCMNHLCDWIENHYGRLAVEVLSRLGGQVAWNDIERWRTIAVGRLATLRMQELFDIVLHWPQSKGGLDDLGSAVTTPQRRLELTDTFSATLQKRLLHPGRSTLDILRTYISMIRTFHALDHSKVLLDRVVPALKLCLWMRDDAIRIVVTGLLSTPQSTKPEDSKGKLVELAVILNDASQQQRSHGDDGDLDWNDMEWVPDPVDAGVNYKRPKNEDIIGTIVGALGLQDVFIKEFQAIIAERLLSKQTTFQQESKVLGLLKKRFGEAALQNCDVMIKDIMDSKRVDAHLRRDLKNTSNPEGKTLSYHAKILSRLFWPSLPKEPFIVPPPVAEIQEMYSAGFEQLKSSRKLNWLDHLGSATVKLDLEDRSIELECKPYEAAVIYAFQCDNELGNAHPQQRTFNELWEKLTIDEDLLEGALRFWVSKRVLRDAGNQTYVVMERLDEQEQTRGLADDESLANGGVESGQPSPKKSKSMDPKEKERRAIYWQFIVGMLTNSSPAMPLGQIAMMMKMLISDGCPWSNEELQEFLGEKIVENELEFTGGKYRLSKK